MFKKVRYPSLSWEIFTYYQWSDRIWLTCKVFLWKSSKFWKFLRTFSRSWFINCSQLCPFCVCVKKEVMIVWSNLCSQSMQQEKKQKEKLRGQRVHFGMNHLTPLKASRSSFWTHCSGSIELQANITLHSEHPGTCGVYITRSSIIIFLYFLKPKSVPTTWLCY